jgi:hypothetical protein
MPTTALPSICTAGCSRAATTSRQASPATGTFHEGLQLVASPAQPTLSELWDGHAAVELLGPAGTEVTMTVKLEDGRVPAWAASVEVVYEKPPRDLFPIKQKSPQSSIPNYC